MIISGFSKLTLLDYPGKVACMLFTQGCNWNCKFCQNSDLIHYDKESLIDEEEIFSYIKQREKVLDGIVISGGEPTMQKDLVEFLKKLRGFKIKIKLDTNGSNPLVIQKIIDEHLVDYIAMDIKNIFEEYEPIINIKKINVDNIKQSINIIKESDVDHEFRTTIMKNYHDILKIIKIYDYLGKDEKYYLQNFEDGDAVLDKSLIAFTKEELVSLNDTLKKNYPNIRVRGI